MNRGVLYNAEHIYIHVNAAALSGVRLTPSGAVKRNLIIIGRRSAPRINTEIYVHTFDIKHSNNLETDTYINYTS